MTTLDCNTTSPTGVADCDVTTLGGDELRKGCKGWAEKGGGGTNLAMTAPCKCSVSGMGKGSKRKKSVVG